MDANKEKLEQLFREHFKELPKEDPKTFPEQTITKHIYADLSLSISFHFFLSISCFKSRRALL